MPKGSALKRCSRDCARRSNDRSTGPTSPMYPTFLDAPYALSFTHAETTRATRSEGASATVCATRARLHSRHPPRATHTNHAFHQMCRACMVPHIPVWVPHMNQMSHTHARSPHVICTSRATQRALHAREGATRTHVRHIRWAPTFRPMSSACPNVRQAPPHAPHAPGIMRGV